MAPPRFSFPPIRGASGGLAVALVVGSLACAVSPTLLGLLALTPAYVLGKLIVTQPLSYAVVAGSPMSVIFGAIIFWSIGGELERAWGRARFLRFALGVPALAGVVTVLLSLGWTGLQGHTWVGAGATMGALWVALGLLKPHSQLNFWGLPMSGRAFAWLGVAFTALNAAFGGLAAVLPDAFALLFTWAWLSGWGPTNLVTRFRSWQLQRELDRRRSGFEVISGDKRPPPSGSDKYLH